MDDHEIIDLSHHILTSISSDLLITTYTPLNGTLNFAWSTEPRASAWAESNSEPSAPPEHKIVFCYELPIKIYRDIENFHKFASNELLNEPYETIFNYFDPKPRLAAHIKTNDSIKNMFIGALTWVFFHELGHLSQEHGYIRKMYGAKPSDSRVVDCDSSGSDEISAREATISHVTELAADVEAAQWCSFELIRHFIPEGGVDEHDLAEFQANLFLMTAGISCALYRFNGKRSIEPTNIPIGSHPTPIRRLEVCIANIFEKLDLGGIGEKLHQLDRKKLVYTCTGAAYSVGFYWLTQLYANDIRPIHFIPKGVLQDPFIQEYWAEIIKTWDEIEPEILRIRRFGSKLGILSFAENLRAATHVSDAQNTPL